MNSIDITAAEARAQFFADTLGLEPPTRLIADDGAPAPELMVFCDQSGMSLDWVFLADLRSMLRATFRTRRNIH